MHLLPRFDPEWEVNALDAIQWAQTVRARHAKKTPKGGQQREHDIAMALQRLKKAMKPIRSELGRSIHYSPDMPSANENRERLGDLSDSLQAERRKLWKMRRRRMNGRAKRA